MSDHTPRPLIAIGSSLDDLAEMPLDIRRAFGRALRAAQNGAYPEDSRPFGEGLPREVLKLIESHHGDTYRAAFVVEFPECVYRLHVQEEIGIGARQPPDPRSEPSRPDGARRRSITRRPTAQEPNHEG